MSKEKDKLTREQVIAIVRSADIGRKIQKYFPEIAHDYRDGQTIPEIIKENDLTTFYGATYNVAHTAVRNALGGYKGQFGRSPYDGLIPQEELSDLIKEHTSVASRDRYAKGKGIAGMSKDEREKALKRAGEVRVKQMQEYQSGFYAQTIEEKATAGKKGVSSRGFKPWTDDEERRLLELYSERPKDAVYAAKVLNGEFHNKRAIRKPPYVSKKYAALRKKG